MDPDGHSMMIWLLAGAAAGVLLTFAGQYFWRWLKKRRGSDVTEEDVLDLVDTAEEQDVIDENQKEMISNIFEFDDVTAGDVMTHRTDLTAVPEGTTLAQAACIAAKEGFSRLPVYRKTLDEITGILYVKDLLFLIENRDSAEQPVEKYMRAATYVPEACHAGELLRDFKRKHTQIAVVVDEYGGTSGLVTMEDILEEIVGNIQDEFDDEEEEMVPCEGGYLCAGSLQLEELYAAFGLEAPEPDEDEDFETVGGLITQRLGRIPGPGEKVELDYAGVRFAVQQVDQRHIVKAKCTRLPGESRSEEEK